MCFAKNSCPFLNAMASIQQIAVQFRKVLGLYHQAMKNFSLRKTCYFQPLILLNRLHMNQPKQPTNTGALATLVIVFFFWDL